MPLDYSSGNKSNVGLMALFPRRSFAKEQAIEERRTQFLALQANQAMQEQATTARAVAEYDSRISAIQQVPFLGADKNNISKWLDEYQKKVKEKIKSEYGDNPKEYIQSEGAFMASKIQNDFLSSGTYKQGEKNRIQAGLAMEALQKGETPIGYFDGGNYVAGTQEINDYMTGKSASITYRGSYKADPNKMIEHFSKMAKPFTVDDLSYDENGNPTGINFEKNNPYLGFKVPKQEAEQFMLNQLGSREALEDFKQKNPGLLDNVKYSNDLSKAFEYSENLYKQKLSQANFAISQGRFELAKEAATYDKMLKGLNIQKTTLDIQKKQNELSGENADVNSNQGLYEQRPGPSLSTNGMDKPLSGREATGGRTAKTIADEKGNINFQSIYKVDLKPLDGTFYEKTKSGIKLSDANANIIVPGSGDLGLKQSDYIIKDLDYNSGLLLDKSNNHWVKGSVYIKPEAYNKIPEAKRKSGKYSTVSVNITKPGEDKPTQETWYKADFYSPIQLKESAIKKIKDSSFSGKYKDEAVSSPTQEVGNYDDYYNL